MPKLKTKTPQEKQIQTIPQVGFFRLNQLVRVPGSTHVPIMPISRTSWLAGVKSGIYPQPVRLGVRTVAWRREDIIALIEKFSAQGDV